MRVRPATVWMITFAIFGSLLGLVAMASPAGAAQVHAHRGGPNVEGVGTYPENSMSAFRHSLAQDWVIEFDVDKTQDGIAVIMHDATLDRTTNCDGKLSGTLWADIESCELDRIGIDDAKVNLPAGDARREPVPRLADVLNLLKETGGSANIEVKSSDTAFAGQVYSQIAASGVDASRLILQNFNKFQLVSVPDILPGASSAVLFPSDNESFAFRSAKEVRANWVSPLWPVSAGYVTRAHAQGFKVVPWTVDEEQDLLALGETGADAVISNDPTRAWRLIGTEPEPPVELVAKLALKIRRSGAVRVRPGQTRVFTAVVANSGEAESGPVRVTAKVPGKSLKLVGKASRTVKTIAAGGKRTVRFRVKVRPKVRKKQVVRLSFTAQAGAGLSSTTPKKKSTLRIVPRHKK